MKYKAIIVDVDRTLVVSKDALPTEKVRKTIQQIKKKMHFGVATSRPYNQIKSIVDYLGLSGPSVVSGGAQIVDVKTGKYYYQFIVERSTTLKICRLLDKHKEITFWIQDNGTDYGFDEKYKPHKPLVIVAYGLTMPVAEQILREMSVFPTVFATKVPSGKEGAVDVHITNSNASKQHSVLLTANLLGIKTKEIVGVGDGYNDYPLLMACGLKVAMGNAVPEIKAIADYVVPSVDGDGLANVIKLLDK